MTSEVSRDGLERLLEMLEGDAALRQQLERAAREGEDSLLSTFVAIGARVGVPPSRADIRALLASADRLWRHTSGELDDHALERVAGGTGDDAQLANVDLQNVLQKRQQALQTMSNISKMLHDTSASIVRKIGG
jgi:hypothetical protein